MFVMMRFQAVMVILDYRERRLDVPIIVFVIILTVAPRVDKVGFVIVYMVVRPVVLLVPVIVLGFGIVR